MAIGTYDDLVASITNWMFDRPDLATVCGDFITLTEGEINRVLRTRHQLKTVQITPDSDGIVTLPGDYLEYRNVVALTVPRRVLAMVSPGYRDVVHPFREANLPSHFTIDGNTLMALPKNASDIEIEYFSGIEPLTPDNQTNWLIQKSPNVYLNGALKHACIFIGNENRAAMFGQIFNGALEALKSNERSAMYAYGAARVRSPTP